MFHTYVSNLGRRYDANASIRVDSLAIVHQRVCRVVMHLSVGYRLSMTMMVVVACQHQAESVFATKQFVNKYSSLLLPVRHDYDVASTDDVAAVVDADVVTTMMAN